MRFSNQQALIVGGGNGMGLEAGRLPVEAGASVTLVGRRQEKLDDARGHGEPGSPESRSSGRSE